MDRTSLFPSHSAAAISWPAARPVSADYAGCVNWGTLLDLSEPQFPNWKTRTLGLPITETMCGGSSASLPKGLVLLPFPSKGSFRFLLCRSCAMMALGSCDPSYTQKASSYFPYSLIQASAQMSLHLGGLLSSTHYSFPA